MTQRIINRLTNIISNSDVDESEIMRQLKNLLDETAIENSSSTDTKSLIELYSENINNWQGNTGQRNLIKTQFTDLDDLLGGFTQGEFIVIGARPSLGKTQLLINLSLNISKTNPLLYFTFDLSDYLLTSRFISTLSNIPIQRILQNDLLAEEKALIASISKELAEHKIYINGGSISSLNTFRIQCQDQIQKNGVKVIMVDFLQMITSNKFRNNREQEVSNFSRELKNIAKENNVVVIATSQLSRGVEYRKESKVPQLSDLRESGSIEQDADKVIFIYRPEYYGINNDAMGETLDGETHLYIAKNRIGQTGMVKIRFSLNSTTFTNMDNDSKLFVPEAGFKNDFKFSTNRINEIHKQTDNDSDTK